MTEHTKRTEQERPELVSWTIFALLICLAAGLLAGPMLPAQALGGGGWVVTAAEMLLLIMVVRNRPKGTLELGFLIQNVCWLFVARVLLGCLSWEGSLAWGTALLCVFAAQSLLGERQREVLLDVVSILVCLLLSVWSVIGLLAAFAGVSVTLPWTTSQIVLKTALDNPDLRYLSFFDLSREAAAALFLSGLGLGLLQWCRHRGLLWRLGSLVSVPLCLLALLLGQAGLGIAAAAVMLALVLAILPQMALRDRGTGPRVAVTIVTALVCGAGLFVGLRIGAVSLSALTVTPPPALLPAVQHAAEAAAPAETGIPALIAAVTRQPIAALLGAGAVETDQQNLFFQQALASGLPGLLIALAFLLSLLCRCVRSWFSPEDTPGAKAASAVLAGLMVAGLFQSLLGGPAMSLTYLFALLAGYLVQHCQEAELPGLTLPRRRRRRYVAQRLTGLEPEEEAEAPEYQQEALAAPERSQQPAPVAVPNWMLQRTREIDPETFARAIAVPEAEAAEAASDDAEAVPDEAEAVPDEAEAVPDEAEAVPDEAEAVPEEAEAVPDEAEAVPDEAEAVPEETETVPEEAEAVPEEAETVSDETEPAPASDGEASEEEAPEPLPETEET